MCIAIAKPIGAEIPNDNILKNCFYNNPDGAGFAFNLNNEVIIRKGYMNLKDFLNAIHEHDKKYKLKNRGMLIHTRITTHGGTNPQMTHPFPICSDEGALKKIEYRSPYAVIHNGIISLTSAEATQKKVLSDTAVFISKYLTKIASNSNWFENNANFELIEDLIDSKMAIINGKGKIKMTSGFTEDNGIFYSNSSYQDNYYRSKYYKNYAWDWYDEYGEDFSYDSWLVQGGYKYDKKDHCWKKPTQETEDKKVDISDKVGLMRLNKDEILVYSDGTTDEYSHDEGLDFFVTDEGDIYIAYEQNLDTDEKEITCELEYGGVGEILDSSLKSKTFSPNCYTTLDNLDGVDYSTIL